MTNDETPLVSIVTPVFNSAKYIAPTIKSVLSQTFTNWEWIFVDGGSSDNSAEIVKEYAAIDSRIRYLFNENDKGPAHARCTAIRNAKGKYIAFLDADDIWLKEKLSKQLSFMEEKQLDFTYTLCRELQYDNRYVSRILPTSPSFSYNDYLRKRGIYAFTVIIRKALLTEDIISIWNKDAFDDTLWWILILKKGVTAYLLPADLGLYRLSPAQLSSRRGHTIKKVYGMYNNFPELSSFQKRIYFISYLFNSAARHFLLKLTPKKPVTPGIL